MKNGTARINVDGITSGLFEAAARIVVGEANEGALVTNFLVRKAREIDEVRRESAALSNSIRDCLENHLWALGSDPTSIRHVRISPMADAYERLNERLSATMTNYESLLGIAFARNERGSFADEIVAKYRSTVALLGKALEANLDLSEEDARPTLVRFEAALSKTG